MTSGEISAIIAIAGSLFSFLGITGIDASVINGAVNGVIAFVTIGAAVVTYIKHRQALQK